MRHHMYLYLDESGDLGLDFNEKKPSRFFVVALLTCNDNQAAQLIKKSVERTVKNKIHAKSKNRKVNELKGISTNIGIKNYFFNHINKNDSFRKYEFRDEEWYNTFKYKIAWEQKFLV